MYLFVLRFVLTYDDYRGGIELRSGGWLPECATAISVTTSFSAERSSIEFFEEDRLIVLP